MILLLHRFSRTELLLGTEGLHRLQAAHVVVFGIGGVGSYAAEALARSGVGQLTLVDYDDICLTNINRQVHALSKTIGQAKVEVMAARIKEISPKCVVEARKEYVDASNWESFLEPQPDYVIDAIDTVTSKLLLVQKCLELGIPIISSMGAGNKLDPTQFRVADISKTSVDSLARIMRKELRKRGIKRGLKVVFSTEPPIEPQAAVPGCAEGCVCPNKERTCTSRRQIPGSTAFVPPAVGLIIASVITREISGLA